MTREDVEKEVLKAVCMKLNNYGRTPQAREYVKEEYQRQQRELQPQ